MTHVISKRSVFIIVPGLLVFTVIVLLSFVIAPALKADDPADSTAAADLGDEINAVSAAAKAALRVQVESGLIDSSQLAQSPAKLTPELVLTSDIVFDSVSANSADADIAFGMLVIRLSDGVHGTPEIRLFIARRGLDSADEGAWRVALEYTPQFYSWLKKLPNTLIAEKSREMLQGSAPNAQTDLDSPQGNGDALLSWPYQFGQTWTFIGGPHGNNGDSVRPWTSLDLGVQGTGKVLAARDGTVWRSGSCPNFVRVDHGGGWQTGYYHLANEQVFNGQFVERGTWIGTTSNSIGCGGWSSGPHVHFTLRRNGTYLNFNGYDVGGWTVEEGNAAYEGCVKRVRDNYRVCRPYGQVYNDGSIGSGDYKDRLDYNVDAIPDVWAVNQHDGVTNSTSVNVVSGVNPQSTLLNSSTGMPQQPAYLNTAFAAADYDDDKVPDLWVIHRLDGAGMTALRIMWGADLRYLILDEITALPAYDNSVSYAAADYNRDGTPDLWAIVPRDPNKSGVAVRVVSGKSLTTTLVDATTALPKQGVYTDVNFAVADYNTDGFSDLWAIRPRDTTKNAVSVKIISGKDWLTVLADEAVALAMQTTDINAYSFLAGDLDTDFTPDLWWVNRTSGQVKVFDGDNFSTVMKTTKSVLPNTYGADWHILGGDRARETIAPQPPTLVAPETDITLNALTARLDWQPAGLATDYFVQIREQGQPPMAQQTFKTTKVCKPALCKIGTGAMGATLHDGKTYQWLVRSINAYGQTTSTTRRFTVDVPGLPTLLVDDGGVFASAPVLLWTGMPLTESYKLQVRGIDNTYKFNLNIPSGSCPSQFCSYALPSNLSGGAYKWKVIARAPSLKGISPTDWRTFTIQPPATATATATMTATATPTATPTATETPTE